MRQWLTPVLAGVLALTFATGAWAASSTSSTSTRSVADELDKAASAIDAGNYQDAIPILEDVVETDPKNADAYNYLGYSYRQLGQIEAAMEHYQTALGLQPKHLGANEYLGELYLQLGNVDKAEERLAVLDKECFFGCEEYSDLKEAIAEYKTQKGAS